MNDKINTELRGKRDTAIEIVRRYFEAEIANRSRLLFESEYFDDDFHYWRGYLDGTKSALSKLEWEIQERKA